MNRVLIAAPIGDSKEYSINEWFNWISLNSYPNCEICLCVNGQSEASVRRKRALLEMVEVRRSDDGILIPFHILQINFNPYHTIKQRLFNAREAIRKYALLMDFDFIFWMDSDTIPYQHDAINILMSKNKSVISGLYFYKGTRQPVILDELTQSNMQLSKIEGLMANNEITKVWGFGFGCVLIRSDAFSRASFDYFYKREDWTEDFQYCEALENLGIERWFCPIVACKHYHAKDFIIDNSATGANCQESKPDHN